MTNEQLLHEIREHGGPALANMLEWSKHWLETAPMMGDKTKTLLLEFCEEHGIDVKLPQKKT